MSIERINKGKIETSPFLEAALNQIENGAYKDVLLVQFYFSAYKCAIYDANASYFFMLKELLIGHATKLEKGELRAGFYTALNYCIKEINEYSTFSVNPYLREAFE